jgi:hypothetical protein
MIRSMNEHTSGNFSANSLDKVFEPSHGVEAKTALPSLLTRERFAELVGLTHKTVYAMCDRGYLPTIHFGRRVFLNMESLRHQCLEKAQNQ